MTVADILQQYRQSLLSIYDASETRAIIRLVFEKVLRLDSLRLEMNKYLLLTTNQQAELTTILERLLKHEPVQYVLGEADFMDMVFKVNRHVLIPRPETEDLVRWIIDEVGISFSGDILDIGTGSGCIAISLKKLLPKANVAACDVCSDALYTATENALALEAEVDFFKTDILLQNPPANYDIIVSNPPYIPLDEKQTLEKHVSEFEPAQALFTPSEQALIFYERIATLSLTHLNEGGNLFFETHTDKANQVAAIMRAKGFRNVVVKKDLFERNRMVMGIR